jgi:hypothetical protein
MEQLSAVFPWLLIGVFAWLIIRGYSKSLGPIELVRRTADECLSTLTVQATTSGHAFDGSEVEVVNREEEITTFNRSVIIGYHCNYLVRSKSGEYFLVIYRHDAKPYVKHTPHEIAQVKLKNKYVPPPSAA